jgi:MYXO-CTERM domain-containing protein
VAAAGSQDLQVRIFGSDFVSGPELTVTFSGDLVAAEVNRVIGTEEIHARLVVGGTAELGPRDVIVTNPGGNSGVGPGLLTIVDPADMQDAGTGGDQTSKGCTCRAPASSPSGSVPALMLLLIMAITLIRRRNP